MRTNAHRLVYLATLLAAAPLAYAGGNGVAVIVPFTVAEGGIISSTVTYTMSGTTMTAGGVIQVTPPSGWGPFVQNGNSAQPGYVAIRTPGGLTMSLQTSTTASMVTATVVSGAVASGQDIQFIFTGMYPNCPPTPNATSVWTIQTSTASGDMLAPIGAFPVQPYAVGPARQITYVPSTPLAVVANTPSSAIQLQLSDACGRSTVATNNLNVSVSGFVPNTTGGYQNDPNAQFSSDGVNFSGTANYTIPTSNAGLTFYYKTGSVGQNLVIFTSYVNPFDNSSSGAWRTVNSLATAYTFSNLSVDTGVRAATPQTSLTFSPDGSGVNNQAFIRFTPSDSSTQWHVAISTDGFNSLVFERWGYGDPLSTLVWDGHNSFNGYSIVPNGIYQVKVEVPGLVSNMLLQITVNSAQVSGRVLFGGNPVAGAQVTAQGSDTGGYSQTTTAADGSYLLSGLRSGGYHYSITAFYTSPSGQVATKSVSNVAVPASNQDLSLITPIRLRFQAQLPSTIAGQTWGQFQVHTADYSQNYSATLHFAAGSSQSDDGNFNPSTWTVLYVAPGNYIVHLYLQGYGLTDFNVSASADFTPMLTPQASVSGNVTLPQPVTVPTWIPIQGTLKNTTVSSVWGGVNLNTGQSTGTYTIFAVAPGTYTFTSNPQGYIPLTVNNVAVGVTDVSGVDFTSFSLGKKITGTLTIQGDSSGLGNPITAWVGAFSPSTNQSAFTQVQLTPNSTSTSASYVLSGLANGTYQINAPYFNGFEAVTNQQTVTINGADGSADFTLQRNSAKIRLTVQLGGPTDYNKVHVSLQGPTSEEIDLTSGPTFDLPFLAAGYYNLTATYLTSGAQKVMNVSVADGQTATASVDLSAQTHSITGIVSVQSPFSMIGSTGTTVAVNTMSDLLSAATTQILTIGASNNGFQCVGGTATPVSTARVEAFPKTFNNYNSAMNSVANCYGVGQYKYGVVDSSGNYSIAQLTPGVWEVDVYPYFDNGSVPNIATVKTFVTVSTADVNGVNFPLANGFSVSGTINLPAGISDVLSLNAQVDDIQGNVIQTLTIPVGVQGTPSTSGSYVVSNLPSGNYSLLVQDPGLSSTNGGQPVAKYVAKPVQFTIAGGNLAGVDVAMANASHIVGRIGIQGTQSDGVTPTFTLISANNISLLPSNFSIGAQANPWVPGGFRSANFGNGGKVNIDDNNQFAIDGLVAGIYDVRFQQNSYGVSVQGQGSLNLATYVQGSIDVPVGQTVDLGTITLLPGISISGTVTDSATHPLANVVVQARPSNQQHGDNGSQTFTDSNGNYTIAGLNPNFKQYDIVAAPRPSPGDSNPLVPYGESRRLAIDVTQIPAPKINFSLQAATGQITGHVVTADNGPLSYTDGDQKGYPVAAIYLKLQGDTQEDNPLGFTNASNLDGRFTIANLVPGIYDITVESFGYGPVKLSGVSITSNSTDLGTITLQRGPVLSVNLVKADGSAVNTNDVDTVVAATPDLGYILFGQVTSDANTNNIVSILFAGFQLSPQTYSIVLIDKQGNLYSPSDGTGIVFTSNSDRATRTVTFAPGNPAAFTHVRRAGSSELITYYLTRPLRNQANDQDPRQWVTLVSGAGTISDYEISSDRRQLTITYNPVANEQRATISFNSHTIDLDPSTGTQFTVSKTITVLLGQKATAEQIINPTIGGKLSLSDNDDPSGITVPSNALRNSDGSALAVSTGCSVTFSATDDASAAAASAPGLFHAPGLKGMLAWSPSAFLSEAYQAMSVAQAQAVNPLSSFYSILLPQGVSHTLNQTAYLTLSYDTAADPTKINVYFFNGTNYIIQPNQRTVDPVNHTITVGVSHFSTFVVLQNDSPIVFTSGDSVSASNIGVFNFPNPFDLKTKTETITHASGTTSMTTDGTIIRYTIPARFIGPATVDIYDVVGHKVRGIDLGAPPADTYQYVTWDGRNDSGHKVASGVYIGELKVKDEKRFFKMAVIK